MNNTSYKFDELMDMMRNSPMKFSYVYFAMYNYVEMINTPKQ